MMYGMQIFESHKPLKYSRRFKIDVGNDLPFNTTTWYLEIRSKSTHVHRDNSMN